MIHGPLGTDFKFHWENLGSTRSAVGGVRGYQMCSEFRSPRSEFSRYLKALRTPSPLGERSMGIRSAGEHQVSLQGTRSLGGYFIGYQVP